MLRAAVINVGVQPARPLTMGVNHPIPFESPSAKPSTLAAVTRPPPTMCR